MEYQAFQNSVRDGYDGILLRRIYIKRYILNNEINCFLSERGTVEIC
jgi:hypothetical protein